MIKFTGCLDCHRVMHLPAAAAKKRVRVVFTNTCKEEIRRKVVEYKDGIR